MTTSSSTLNAMLITVIIVATLSLAREVLLPIALACILSFMLAPPVRMLQNRRVPRGLAVAAVVLLAGWTALFFLLPAPDGPFSPRNHIGLRVDRAIFHYDYDPAYSTLNFIPSTVWTLSGAWVGKLLMTSKVHRGNLAALAGGMVLCFAMAWGLHPWIPFVKQLCTASFMLYSLGWVLFMLIGFYIVIEVLGYRKWTFPLVVVGMNSIFIYFVSEVLFRWLDGAVGVFTFHYHFIGKLAPVAQATTVLLVMWYACYWLYNRKIFFKL